MRGLDTVGYPVAALSLLGSRRLATRGRYPVEPIVNGVATADATAHTKGAWSQLVASSAAGTGIDLWIGNVGANGTDTRMLVDIGFGAAASEVVMIPNIPLGMFLARINHFPVPVPAGTRISVRSQSLITVDTAVIHGAVVNDGTTEYKSLPLINYGADTATSSIITLPTASTYVEFVASTAVPLRGLVLLAGAGTMVGSTTTENIVYTVAVGASGSEVALFSTTLVWLGTESVYDYSVDSYRPIHIPAGSRVAVKASIGRAFSGAVVLGVPY